MTSETFSTLHIGVTAIVTGVLSIVVARPILRHEPWLDAVSVGVVAGLATFGWRLCANLPQLNADGVPGFSANDLAAPIATWVLLGIYAAVRPPADPRRFALARAAATGIALVVNVVTI
jgi:hypothetical protein